MLTYEYECDKCHRVFEVRQRISDPPLQTCEACGGDVRRLLSPAPFILKGGGWYVTDYPSEARKKALEAEKPAASAEKASAEKKTDSTPTSTTTAATSASTTTSAPASSPASTSSDSTSSESKKKPD